MKQLYTAFYNGTKLEDIEAATALDARKQALDHFQATTRKKVKAWDVTVLTQANHSTAEI